MEARDAARLIAPAVGHGEVWADLGAGTGTFTAALAGLVGPAGAVYAVERDAADVPALESLARRGPDVERSRIIVLRADLTHPLDLPPLNGILLANSLHFVDAREQAATLRRLVEHLVDDGRMLVVEYDDRPPSRWVPFPVSLARLRELAPEASLGAPDVIGRTESAFGGTMYAARLRRA